MSIFSSTFLYWEFHCPHLSLSFIVTFHNCWCGEDLQPWGTEAPFALPSQRGPASTSYMGDPLLKHVPVDAGTWILPSKPSSMVVSLVSSRAELKLFGKFHSSNLRADFVQFCWVGPKHDNLIRRSRPPCMLMFTLKCLFPDIQRDQEQVILSNPRQFFLTYCAKVAKWKKQAACLVSNTDSSHIPVGSPEHVQEI